MTSPEGGSLNFPGAPGVWGVEHGEDAEGLRGAGGDIIIITIVYHYN